MLHRRTVLTTAAAATFIPAAPAIVRAAETPGVTATEIRLGNTVPYSGPASAYGTLGKAEAAMFKMANDQGGFAGRKVNFISYDDGYSPPKTVEQARRLIEEDRVAALFATLGTPTNSAIVRYVNMKKVPQLFVATGADKWGDYKEHPWTIGWQPSYVTESQVYGKYILAHKPDAKIGILYQNDDFGKDYLHGMRDALKDRYAHQVTEVSYEVTDATVDSQLVSLQSAKVEVLLTVATPKFAAQTIRKLAEMRWKPLHILTGVSVSVGAVMLPAGPENGVGIVSSAYLKDPTDPRWENDAGMKKWREFMAKYYPDGDVKDGGNVAAYGLTDTMIAVLKACGNDLSRHNMMKQATNLHNLENPVLLPGIRINTSPTNYHPIRQLQLMRWNGKTWDLFGDIIEGASAA
ncbi:ABC transporter substrate-binding protein [Rhodopila globiformis]|uniref:Branched-chain amino acid ABC transporter substrate-binding protein n=1 Tax=Rhodopila globiformis TaxID=1071 RepID=A0A2S6MV02_RHOGL|nr:ABC transporter substrate-binding protein [Rhodopila globiformis]PPQ26191.1 branched-chain amino acid ABC transporter substrate-binding protein [Rhodopila globiformis]